MSRRSMRLHRSFLSSTFDRTRCLALQRRPLSLAISTILAAGPLSVAAQDEPVVEVIIVTATRRAESVQDVPINIAAFEGDLLERREITDLAELGRNVPGLYVVDQGKRNANHIIVRGLNLDTIRGPEALGNNGGETVATYVGEIPLYIDFDLTDMERVEVLLGPQGTLYGAGTLGGAIRYIPERPDFTAPTLTFRATSFDVGESDGYGVRGGMTANFPLGDNLALRATVNYYDDPGFIDAPFLVRESGVSDPEPDFTDPAAVAANLYSIEDVNDEQTLSGRIALRWQPTDALDTNFTYFYQDRDVGGRSDNHSVAFQTDLYTSGTRYPEPNSRENSLAALEITADLGFAELTSATGYSRYHDLGQRDQTDLLITLDYGYEAFPSFSAFTRDDQADDTFTQELRLVSKSSGALTWIGGLFYMDQRSAGTSKEFTPHYDEYLGGVLRPDSLEYINIINSDLKETGVFGEIGYEFTDRWQVTLGGRWYDYEYGTESGVTFPLFLTAIGDLPPDAIDLTLEPSFQEDDGFLYKFNTSYRFTDDVLGYLTVSEGYRIGAANGVAACPDPLPVNQIACALPDEFQYFADYTTNYEVGLRSQWLDQRLTFNAALYYIDWQDPQLLSQTANGAQPITINGEGAESTGVELSLNLQVTDRLGLGLSYAQTKAELSEVAPDLLRVFIPPGFGPSDPAVYEDGVPGDRLPGSPQEQGTFSVDYFLPLGATWDLDFTYGLQAIGDVLTKTAGKAGGERLGGFTVHSASVMLDRGSWQIGLYAQNLTNKYAVTGVRSQRPFVQTVADENGDPVTVRSYSNNVLRPREVGIKFTYDLEL